MSKREYSEYQLEAIGRYYDNLDTIMLQKLQELVTELYLADSPARQNRLWQRVQKAMIKLKVPDSIMNHIMAQRSAEILAKNIEDWLKHAGSK